LPCPEKKAVHKLYYHSNGEEKSSALKDAPTGDARLKVRQFAATQFAYSAEGHGLLCQIWEELRKNAVVKFGADWETSQEPKGAQVLAPAAVRAILSPLLAAEAEADKDKAKA
jgi:hypothetical protein